MTNAALIVTDVQNDFGPGGALEVPKGDEVVPVINKLMASGEYDTIVLTQCWHPANHISFGTWPPHCIQGSVGADFHPGLLTRFAHVIIRKGTDPAVDSYSAFLDNDKISRTGLSGYLYSRGVGKVDVVGLALDYCVKATALDAIDFEFETRILLAGCRAIDPKVKPKSWGIKLA